MLPNTQRVCLTAIESTKHLCIAVPTLEGLKLALAKFHREVLFRHPKASAAILLLWYIYPKSPFTAMYYFFYIILKCIGFEEGGVRRDSYASKYQSRVYGGQTPRNSIFSTSQSYGATENERRAGANAGMGFVGFHWRIPGLLCVYAVLVMLLKYDYYSQ